MSIKYLSLLLIATAITITSCLQQNVEKKDATINEVQATSDKKNNSAAIKQATQKTDKWAQYRGHAIEFDRILTKYQSEDDALRDILNSGDVIMDFYADWCGPCKQMGPNFSAAAQRLANVLCIKINVDKHQNITAKYVVKAMPTLIYVKNGSIAKRVSGYRTEAQIIELIQ